MALVGQAIATTRSPSSLPYVSQHFVTVNFRATPYPSLSGFVSIHKSHVQSSSVHNPEEVI
ncbi:hypothetical protein [Vacuolonema iberomarrocanum]|uniref:hypothetical protein n=1 Tax=Vacuolonema iberomarrocanum TaxID=3454632 RepID=UPI0019EA96EF|nr:hypothetical protein [filamentous cyanobacterium LEGE 07170]